MFPVYFLLFTDLANRIRGSFQSYINITYGLASMSGAALGGAMADYFGWRWEFGVQVPVILLCLIIAILVVPGDLGLDGKEKQTLREAMRTFDFKGSILLSSSVTFLILGLVRVLRTPKLRHTLLYQVVLS